MRSFRAKSDNNKNIQLLFSCSLQDKSKQMSFLLEAISKSNYRRYYNKSINIYKNTNN